MSSEQLIRRSSYGRNSPQVRERGARTRQRILDETLLLFEERGYYGTLVDDIAKRYGVSRATLYQYFESKEGIFRELLEECGGALTRVLRRLGPLGPTEQGFDNLHWWLGEWAWVYDKYATMFAQWTQVARSGPLRETIHGFVGTHGGKMAQRLLASGVTGINPQHTATILIIMVNRFHDYRRRGLLRPLTDEQAIDSLAVAVQLMLFPDTPSEVLNSIGIEEPDRPSPREGGSGDGPLPPDRFEGMGARARTTAGRLLDAACEIFADNGYHTSTIDDVVTKAGVARGTFYKYFEDKTDLLRALTEQAYREAPELLARFAELRPGSGLDDQLRAWLRAYEPWRRRYIGIVRVWIERQSAENRLERIGVRLALTVATTFQGVLARVERDYPFSETVGVVIIPAILERVLDGMPLDMSGEEYEEVLDLMAALIERGLLNGRV